MYYFKASPLPPASFALWKLGIVQVCKAAWFCERFCLSRVRDLVCIGSHCRMFGLGAVCSFQRKPLRHYNQWSSEFTM